MISAKPVKVNDWEVAGETGWLLRRIRSERKYAINGRGDDPFN